MLRPFGRLRACDKLSVFGPVCLALERKKASDDGGYVSRAGLARHFGPSLAPPTR